MLSKVRFSLSLPFALSLSKPTECIVPRRLSLASRGHCRDLAGRSSRRKQFPKDPPQKDQGSSNYSSQVSCGPPKTFIWSLGVFATVSCSA